MESIISSMRQIVGAPEFYVDGVIDFGLALEYLCAVLLLVVVVSSIFKFLIKAVFR